MISFIFECIMLSILPLNTSMSLVDLYDLSKQNTMLYHNMHDIMSPMLYQNDSFTNVKTHHLREVYPCICIWQFGISVSEAEMVDTFSLQYKRLISNSYQGHPHNIFHIMLSCSYHGHPRNIFHTMLSCSLIFSCKHELFHSEHNSVSNFISSIFCFHICHKAWYLYQSLREIEFRKSKVFFSLQNTLSPVYSQQCYV